MFNKTRDSIKYQPSEPTSAGSAINDPPQPPPTQGAPQQSLGALLKQLRMSKSINTPVGMHLQEEVPTVKVSSPP